MPRVANKKAHGKKPAPPAAKRTKAASTTGRATTPTAKTRAKAPIAARAESVDAYVKKVISANSEQLMELEQEGVPGTFITGLSERLNVPKQRMYGVLGISKATAERKATKSGKLTGASGYAALGMAKLLGIAQEIVDNSTAEEANGFDAAAWLGEWIERPQPALGGRKPAEMLKTPTGIKVVARLLGSLESGAYQ